MATTFCYKCSTCNTETKNPLQLFYALRQVVDRTMPNCLGCSAALDLRVEIPAALNVGTMNSRLLEVSVLARIPFRLLQ